MLRAGGESRAQSLEACMASSITQAREGKLYLMCGGAEAAFRKAEPVLRELAATVRFIGKAGRSGKSQSTGQHGDEHQHRRPGRRTRARRRAWTRFENASREVFAQTGAASRVLETDGEDMQNRDHSCFFSARACGQR